MEIPEGMDKPYFLMGDPLEPVYLWHWESTADGAQEADARGLGTMAASGRRQPVARVGGGVFGGALGCYVPPRS